MRIMRRSTMSMYDIVKKKNIMELDLYNNLFDKISQYRLKEMDYHITKSVYNYEYFKDDYLIVWNAASEAIAILEECEIKLYLKGTSKIETCFDYIMYNEGFYINADLNERFRIDLIRKRRIYQYSNGGHVDIEILPTQVCNARCFYCFEKKYNYITMNDEVVNDVIKYITSTVTLDNDITFIWFGGEPLIAADIIDKIIDNVNVFFNNKLVFSSSITTNNSLIDAEMIDKFKKWRVNDVLTTIDGYKDEHNKRKNYVVPFNAYEKTLGNIRLLLENDINVTCRLNMDKKNITQLESILDDLTEFRDKNKFNIQITTLRDRLSTENKEQIFFMPIEFEAFYSNTMDMLFEKGFIDSKKVLDLIPKRSEANCLACSLNKIVINSDGYLYKCVQDELEIDNSVGNCSKGIVNNYNYSKWFREIDNLGETCEECRFLPCCQGGCKIYRISPTEDTIPCNRKKFYYKKLLEFIEVEDRENAIFDSKKFICT